MYQANSTEVVYLQLYFRGQWCIAGFNLHKEEVKLNETKNCIRSIARCRL